MASNVKAIDVDTNNGTFGKKEAEYHKRKISKSGYLASSLERVKWRF